MKYRRLGRTNVSVSELALGFAFVAEQGQALVSRAVHRAFDLGVNYFDTAPYYSAGLDEQMLGEALHGMRDRAVLATKVGYTQDPNDHRSVAGLMRQLDQSLQRLGVDHVDVVQVHESDFRKWWVDEPISAEEGLNPSGAVIADDETYDFAGAPVAEFLLKARESGKTRFVGLTGKDARRVTRVAQALDVDTVMVAHQFNPIMRNAGTFLFPTASAKDLGVLVAAPLMRGLLARPKQSWRTAPPDWMDETFAKAYFGFLDLAEKSGLSVPELTFRWLLENSSLNSIVFGFRAVEEVEGNVGAALRGPLPAALKSEIDALGIVHPLIFQGRTSL